MTAIVRCLVPPMFWGVVGHYNFKIKVPMLLRAPDFPLTKTNEKALNCGSKEYLKAVQLIPDNNLNKKFAPFIKKCGIREDIVFIEEESRSYCYARGTNYFRQGDAVIIASPNLHATDEDAFNFVIKHEIAHIAQNHVLWQLVIGAITSVASAIFFAPFGMPLLLGITLDIAIGIIASVIFSQVFERKADNFAIENSTDNELTNARRFFKAHLQKR